MPGTGLDRPRFSGHSRPELEPIAADAKARLQEALRTVADRSA
ncbi:protein of unknown function [Blastococcus saxobsidens DD2]|uniref:Uncharacterized protein n=1 Tax=Blastococcus saxobsidens (strain DD2) TaxID=1146883 RepID=H6RQX5_BLASD|nr:protein of unknown function [Blastococcus saxobsidens DD2]